MKQWMFASAAVLALTAASDAQVIFYPPVAREFVDHPYNPRLDSDAVNRLRSLEEAGRRWDEPSDYIDVTTGQRLWAVDDQREYGRRTWLSDQPLYFRKADLLPRVAAPEGHDDEMIDVRDLAEPAASAGTIEIKPWRGRSSDNAGAVSD